MNYLFVKGIRTPSIYMIHPTTSSIYMEYIDGYQTANSFISEAVKVSPVVSKYIPGKMLPLNFVMLNTTILFFMEH